MDPVERLASDLQALKTRFDEMSLRFAVSEEREKRVDDKIDNMVDRVEMKMNAAVASITSEMGTLKKSINDRSVFWRVVVGAAIAVIVGIVIRWMTSGSLAGF